MLPMFGTNPIARRQRVYYTETASTIYEGMPVCFEFDATANVLGYDKGAGGDVGSQTSPTTTAEGNQNEGKFLRVEDPDMDNLDFFAGVIAGTSEAGKLGGRWVDIFIPNGAIVPVKTVLAATQVGRTILSINSATQTLGNPTSDVPNYGITAGTIDAKPVAIAMETISAAGLCLAKLDPNLFIHQGGQVDYEMEAGYVGTVKTAVNRMNVKFEQTAGDMCLNHWRANCAGGGSSAAQRGMFRFETFLTGTVSALMWGIDSMMDLGANITDGYYSPLHLTIRSRSNNPDLSNVYLAVQYMEYILTKTTSSALDNPPYMGCWFMFNTDVSGSVPDYLFYAVGKKNVCMAANDVAAGDSAANSISIWVEGLEYHIPCYTDAELV